MLDFGFYNMDCMEGMKQFPDKYFDLAIVDPPYGDARGGQANRFGQRFDRYKKQGGADTGRDGTADSRTEHGVTRIGGTWAAKYAKKSLRGTLPRSRNISQNCFVSHGTRLSGGATISSFLLHGVS